MEDTVNHMALYAIEGSVVECQYWQAADGEPLIYRTSVICFLFTTAVLHSFSTTSSAHWTSICLQLSVGMARSDREEYLFNRFHYRLPKALQSLHLQELADERIKGYKQAKKWQERVERVDAPEQASKL